jgi:hypothetical protein
MNQGNAIRSLSFREFTTEGDPDGEEKKDENSKKSMKTGDKNFTLQIEKDPEPYQRTNPEKHIKSFPPSDMLLPRKV